MAVRVTKPGPLVTMGTIIRFPNRVRAELRGRLGEVLGPAGPGTVDVLVGDIVVSVGTLKAACWRDNYQREQS